MRLPGATPLLNLTRGLGWGWNGMRWGGDERGLGGVGWGWDEVGWNRVGCGVGEGGGVMEWGWVCRLRMGWECCDVAR